MAIRQGASGTPALPQANKRASIKGSPLLPINPNKKVKNEKCDVGIIFDGDADRVCVVDNYGNFISGVINFLIMAWIVFLMVKLLNKLKHEEPKVEEAPTTKECPFCKSTIAIAAVKCPHCTSELPEEEEAGEE